MRLNFEMYESIDGKLSTAYLMRRHTNAVSNRLPFFTAWNIFLVNFNLLFSKVKYLFSKNKNG